MILQNDADFSTNNGFITKLMSYHNMDETFLRNDTRIQYTSSNLVIEYVNGSYSTNWIDRLNFKLPKVAYIPSERNLVAIVPDLNTFKSYDNIIDFITTFREALNALKKDFEILNTGFRIHYDQKNDMATIQSAYSSPLNFRNVSSGFQSLAPLYVFLHYLFIDQFLVTRQTSIKKREELQSVINFIVSKNLNEGELFEDFMARYNSDPLFKQSVNNQINNFVHISHNEIFIEEPENNLYHLTQKELMEWIIAQIQDSEQKNRNDIVCLTTHSPFILETYLSKSEELNLDFNLYFTKKDDNGLYSVTSADKEKQNSILTNGLFLVIDSYC